MSKIFISYRRDDSQHVTARIYDRMEQAFGAENVFWDVQTIPPAVDFRRYIQDKMADCDIVLVIIGKDWLRILKERESDRVDYVRAEIEVALKSDKTIIPVLLEGVTPIGRDDLPPRIAKFAFINTAKVDNDPDFNIDVQKLIDLIKSERRQNMRLPRFNMSVTELMLVAVVVLLIIVMVFLGSLMRRIDDPSFGGENQGTGVPLPIETQRAIATNFAGTDVVVRTQVAAATSTRVAVVALQETVNALETVLHQPTATDEPTFTPSPTSDNTVAQITGTVTDEPSAEPTRTPTNDFSSIQLTATALAQIVQANTVENDVPIADGFDSPVGTEEQRRSTEVWPDGWLDASPFGRLYFVGTPSEAYHTGADLNFGAPYEDKGMPVYAIGSGVVTYAGTLNQVWGGLVIIKHDPLYTADGPVFYSRYQIGNIQVEVGERVERGQQIAEISDANGRMVPHLHLDISSTDILEREPGDWPGTNQARLLENYVDPLLTIRTYRPADVETTSSDDTSDGS